MPLLNGAFVAKSVHPLWKALQSCGQAVDRSEDRAISNDGSECAVFRVSPNRRTDGDKTVHNGLYAGVFTTMSCVCRYSTREGPMITNGPSRDNDPRRVFHRFHKRQSCVFHIIHRFSTSFSPAGATLSTCRNAEQNRCSTMRPSGQSPQARNTWIRLTDGTGRDASE